MQHALGSQAVLAPVIVLVAWTLVMMLWLYATRIPAITRSNIALDGMVGSRPGGLDGILEDKVQWKAHNYNHLTEQPTLFYAVAISLALLGHGGGSSAWLAWIYVGLRIVHSLIQATVNIVKWRFMAFAAASFFLLLMTMKALAILVCISF